MRVDNHLLLVRDRRGDVLRDDDLCGGVGLQSPLSRHVSSPGSLASVVMKASEPASDSQHSVELASLENATTAAHEAGVSPNRIFGAVYAALEKAGATDLGHNPAEFGLLPVIGSPNLLLGFCSSLLFHICGVGLWGLASSVGGTLLGMLVGIAYSGFLFFRGRYLSRQDGGGIKANAAADIHHFGGAVTLVAPSVQLWCATPIGARDHTRPTKRPRTTPQGDTR